MAYSIKQWKVDEEWKVDAVPYIGLPFILCIFAHVSFVFLVHSDLFHTYLLNFPWKMQMMLQ